MICLFQSTVILLLRYRILLSTGILDDQQDVSTLDPTGPKQLSTKCTEPQGDIVIPQK